MSSVLLTILGMYCCAYVTVAAHEFSHFVVFYILSGVFPGITLGSTFLSLKIGKISISPILITAYNEIPEDELKLVGNREQIFFYSAGIFANLSMICFLLVVITIGGWSIITLFALTMNIVVTIMNLLPIEGTDCCNIIEVIKTQDEK